MSTGTLLSIDPKGLSSGDINNFRYVLNRPPGKEQDALSEYLNAMYSEDGYK